MCVGCIKAQLLNTDANTDAKQIFEHQNETEDHSEHACCCPF